MSACPDLSIIHQSHLGYIVRHTPSGRHTALPMRSIAGAPWKEIEDVLCWRRSPRVMTHVTRIVGYYSMIHNWNRSKVAELHDRQRGNYAL
jgi:hypothetical protein